MLYTNNLTMIAKHYKNKSSCSWINHKTNWTILNKVDIFSLPYQLINLLSFRYLHLLILFNYHQYFIILLTVYLHSFLCLLSVLNSYFCTTVMVSLNAVRFLLDCFLCTICCPRGCLAMGLWILSITALFRCLIFGLISVVSSHSSSRT